MVQGSNKINEADLFTSNAELWAKKKNEESDWQGRSEKMSVPEVPGRNMKQLMQKSGPLG